MKKILLGLFVLATLLVPAADLQAQSSTRTRTSIFQQATNRLKDASKEAQLGDPADVERSSANLVSTIINTIAGLLAVIAVVLVIYAGGLWLTAAGNDSQIGKAKTIIQQTIIGVFIVGFAYAIVAFVFSILLPSPAEQAPTGKTEPVPTRVE